MGQTQGRLPSDTELAALNRCVGLMRTHAQRGDARTEHALRAIWAPMQASGCCSDEEAGQVFAVPSPNWKTFGFQNINPLSDLRGGGLLALQFLAQWAVDEQLVQHIASRNAHRRREETTSGTGQSMFSYYPPMAAGVSVCVQMLRLFLPSPGSSVSSCVVLPYWPFVVHLEQLFNYTMEAIDAHFVAADATYLDFPSISRTVLDALPGLMTRVASGSTGAGGGDSDGDGNGVFSTVLIQTPVDKLARLARHTLGAPWPLQGGRRTVLGAGGDARQSSQENIASSRDAQDPMRRVGLQHMAQVMTCDPLLAKPLQSPAKTRNASASNLAHASERFTAAEEGDAHTTMSWLRQRSAAVDVGDCDRHGWTQLHYAARFGHEAIVKMLVEHGADPNVASPCGLTPLEWATHYHHPGVVRVLLEQRERRVIFMRRCILTHALMLAAAAGHDQIVRWLLAAVEFTPRELEIAEEEYRCRAPRKRVRQESGLDGLDLLHFFSPKHKHKHKRFAGTAQAKLLLHKERRALNWIRRRDALLVRARVTRYGALPDDIFHLVVSFL